jgi:glutaredoxin
MPEKILIFGKDSCPFTKAAREAFSKQGREVEYINVLSEPDKRELMLRYSGGSNRIPLIVNGDEIIIGFKGKS